MRYYPTGNLYDYIGYYQDIKKKYGKQYWLFDPLTLDYISGLFNDINSTYKKDYYKVKKLPRPDRIQIEAIRFPVSCGVNFSSSLAIQIQKQIEDRIGISRIHTIPGTFVRVMPFYPNRMWYIDDTFIVKELINGVHYTYLQTSFLSTLEWGRKCDYNFEHANPLLWIRCYYEDSPEKDVDFWDETGKITFEICDEPPESFPPIKKLPKFIQDQINNVVNFSKTPSGLEFYYEKYTYDKTQLWVNELKTFFQKAIERNAKKKKGDPIRKSGETGESCREERENAETGQTPPQASASDGQSQTEKSERGSMRPIFERIVKKSGVDRSLVELADDVGDGYPDLLFNIEYEKDIDEDLIGDLEEKIGSYTEKKDCVFSYYAVTWETDDSVTLHIDSGEAEEKHFRDVLRILCDSAVKVKRIRIQ